MQIPAVRLQMNDTARLEEVSVTVHEKRSGKTLLLTSDLRIRECNPYFRNLARSKNRLDELDTRTDECHILEGMLFRILGTLPQTRSFDIHTNVVELRVTLGKVNGIVTFSTTELDHNRIVIAKEVAAPISLDRMVTAKDLGCCRLDQAPEGLIFTKFSKFVFSHNPCLCFTFSLNLFLRTVVAAVSTLVSSAIVSWTASMLLLSLTSLLRLRRISLSLRSLCLRLC